MGGMLSRNSTVFVRACGICKNTFETKGRHPCKDGMSRCSTCMIDWKRQSRKSYMSNLGFENRKDMRLRREYGITYSEYKSRLDEQSNCCCICGKLENQDKRKLAVDHCHKTGAIRGILCQNCNSGLGHFRDDPAVVLMAVGYLLKSLPKREPDVKETT